MRYVRELDADLFREVKRGLEIEVGDIKCDKLGVFLKEGAIYDKLEKIQGGSSSTNVTRVVDVIAADVDAGAIWGRIFQVGQDRPLCSR